MNFFIYIPEPIIILWVITIIASFITFPLITKYNSMVMRIVYSVENNLNVQEYNEQIKDNNRIVIFLFYIFSIIVLLIPIFNIIINLKAGINFKKANPWG